MDDLFHNCGFVSSGVLNISPHEAMELCEKGAVIIDVREAYLNNFKNFGVKKVFLLPMSELRNKYSDLPADSYMIFADTVGLRSKEAVVFLSDKGYKRIANLAGGIVDWERDGLPLNTNAGERLTGSCICQLRARERKSGIK